MSNDEFDESTDEVSEGSGRMSFLEHLDELRRRGAALRLGRGREPAKKQCKSENADDFHGESIGGPRGLGEGACAFFRGRAIFVRFS